MFKCENGHCIEPYVNSSYEIGKSKFPNLPFSDIVHNTSSVWLFTTVMRWSRMLIWNSMSRSVISTFLRSRRRRSVRILMAYCSMKQTLRNLRLGDVTQLVIFWIRLSLEIWIHWVHPNSMLQKQITGKLKVNYVIVFAF